MPALALSWVLLAAAPGAAAPVEISYRGYIGGDRWENPPAVAVDAAGDAYVATDTRSSEATFPVVIGPDLTFNGVADVAVVKVASDGSNLVYSGFIGGAGGDCAATSAIAVDEQGRAYIAGCTNSADSSFPTLVGPDLTYNGGQVDAFVAKVAADGSALVYCGYIGGDGDEGAFAIAVDLLGAAYVAGDTDSTETTFPVSVGPGLTYNGGGDAFIAKVRPGGADLEWAGYVGGDASDTGRSVAVNSGGDPYLAGGTFSTEATFPAIGGPDVTANGDEDGYIARVRSDGSGLEWAGYIGGDGLDYVADIAVGSDGSGYLVGSTRSTHLTFAVAVGPDLTFNGGLQDAFVARVRPDGSGLVFAGYIGGDDSDSGMGIAVDAGGEVHVAGGTYSSEATFPVALGPDLTYNGSADGFAARVSASGSALDYCGYIGGEFNDGATSVAVDASGNVYVVGGTRSTESTFPVAVGPDLTYNGGLLDAFVAKLEVAPECALPPAVIGGLTAVRGGATRDDVDLAWQPDPAALGYNVWYVTEKTLIDQARQATSPPAVPVAGCANPTPAAGPICTDLGAVRRLPEAFYYQVRAYCDPLNEGP